MGLVATDLEVVASVAEEGGAAVVASVAAARAGSAGVEEDTNVQL